MHWKFKGFISFKNLQAIQFHVYNKLRLAMFVSIGSHEIPVLMKLLFMTEMGSNNCSKPTSFILGDGKHTILHNYQLSVFINKSVVYHFSFMTNLLHKK